MSQVAVGDLRERLARLGAPPRPRPPRPETPPMPRGFEVRATPYGDALLREDVLSLPPLEPNPGRVAYIDTETTGLSGGTGTFVFAAAVAQPIECGLRLAQLFLPQPSMEPAFLHAFRAELDGAEAVATFNGSSFDLPLLRTRWVMARMGGELAHAPHIDLLTIVRALYRHQLDTCTLRNVEERLLGYERDDPISGAFAPDAYFAYLRREPGTLLEMILEHNRLDVVSLVHLHSRLLRRLRGADAGMDAADWLALGCHQLRRGARADGWRALRNAAGFGTGEAAATAGLHLARKLTRRGAVAGAETLLGWLEARVSDDVRLPIARAKLLEWRRRDPQLALSVVEAARRRMPDEGAGLGPRLMRLRRKTQARKNGSPASTSAWLPIVVNS
jgi:hypothetical protein